MSAPTGACCSVTLNQQQEETVQHHAEQCGKAAIAPCKNSLKNCTVVEHGRVVVKPIQPLAETAVEQ